MAQNVFKVSRPGYGASSDPMRDLAAITGYRPAKDDSGEEFAIDLERELLGAIDDDSEPEFASAAPQPVNDDEFHSDFAAAFEAQMAEPAEHDFEAELRASLAGHPVFARAQPPVSFDTGADADIDLDFSDLDLGLDAALDRPAPAGNFEDDLMAYVDDAPGIAAPSEPEDRWEEPAAWTAEPAAEAGFESALQDELVADEAANASWNEEIAGDVTGDISGDLADGLAADFEAGLAADEEPVADWSHVTHPEGVWEETQAPQTAAAAVPAETVQAESADPFADLARLAASYAASRPVFSRAPIWANRKPELVEPAAPAAEPVAAEAPVYETAAAHAVETEYAQYSEPQHEAPRFEPAGYDAPDFETVEVPDELVALADDLDLPEVAWDDAAPAVVYDDLDADFGQAAAPMQAAQPVQAELDVDPFAGKFDDYFMQELALADEAAPEPVHQTRAPVTLDEELRVAAPPQAAPGRPQGPGRGMLVAAAVGGLALLGAIGVYALSGKTSATNEPALVKADDGPVKVKPENPGGAKIGNQESAVYDKVAGADAAAPAQDKLITTAEEPVDVAKILPEAASQPLGEAKGEDRVLPEAETNPAIAPETIAVQPKRVKTMVVKPDGSMVMREEAPAEAVAAAKPEAAEVTYTAPAADAAAEKTVEGAEIKIPDAPAAEPETAAAAKAAEAAAEREIAAVAKAPAEATIEDAIAETAAPVAEKPKKPAKKAAAKPVKAVAPAAEETQVALAEPAAATGGGWSIQIASQPTKDGAQSSYKTLAARYGSIIGGRGVQIIAADIAGKGTFYRVRVPAGSKEEAAALCARFKSAGGSCFATR